MILPPLAWLALANLCSDPYCRSRVDTMIQNDPNAHCLYWNDTVIAFTQSQLGNPATPDQGFPAVSAAWASWRAVAQSCSSLQLSEAPHSASRTAGYNPNGANENLAMFRQTDCHTAAPMTDGCWNRGDCDNVYDCWPYPTGTIALTTTTYDTKSGIIYDADIELNAAHDVFTDVNSPQCFPTAQNQTCVAVDIQNTVTHETGHALGLDHNTSPSSTMFNSAPVGETSKRTIDPGSARFVCDVYPDGGPPRDCIIVAMPPVLPLGAQAGCGAAGAGPVAVALSALAFAGRKGRR